MATTNELKNLDQSYQGDLLHNRYNGRGVYRCSLGQYNGEFKDGYFHGEGETLYVSPLTYLLAYLHTYLYTKV